MKSMLELKFYFGNTVLRARLKAGLSQKELSKRSGVKKKIIYGIEGGLANPTITQMFKICGVLGVGIDFQDRNQ